MNSRSLFWGIFLILLGIVYLLRQMGMIYFHIDWLMLFRFWPLFLIIAGLRLILPKQNKGAGILLILLMFAAFAYVIFQGFSMRKNGTGQYEKRGWDFHDQDADPESGQRHEEPSDSSDDDKNPGADSSDEDENEHPRNASTHQDFKIEDDSKIRSSSFDLEGGAAEFSADVTHSNLFEASILVDKANYRMERSSAGDRETIKLVSEHQGFDHSNHSSRGRVLIRLNPRIEWDLAFHVGAGKIQYDFSGYKIRNIDLNTGLAAVNLKLGNQLGLTNIRINAGVASFEISIPESSGCQLSVDGGLNSNDLPGFTKINDHTWQNSKYTSASKKIIIDYQGAITSFLVKTY